VLLVLTVVVSALVTRLLAGGGGSSDAGASLPRGVADMTVNETVNEGDIVSGYVGASSPTVTRGGEGPTMISMTEVVT
jgi:hypothetical protein